MKIEYEATFGNVNKNKIRKILVEINARLVKKEFLQRRTTFSLPSNSIINNGWARVRDEGDRVTMSIKSIIPGKIEGQKETQLIIDSFDEGVNFLGSTGFVKKSYQETLRELWAIGNVEIMIDTWPYLEPILEIEGDSEKAVKEVSELIGLDYDDAIFEGVDYFYNLKYGIDKFIINNKIPVITFKDANPFLNII